MPINLFKLPSLVGVLVVTELDYQEIFLLSLCSRRTNSLVRKAKIKAPKLAFRLEECRGYNEFNIGVVIDNWIPDCIWLPVTSLVHVDTLALTGIFTVKLGRDYEAETNFDSQCKKDGNFVQRMECANEPIAIQKALQDHINSIFHYSETNKLYLSMKSERSLPNVTNVQEIEIRHGTVHPQFLEDILTTYPDLRTISIKPRIVGKIPKDSQFFQIQNVHIKSCSVSDYIHNFVGRNMRLNWVTLTDQDLIQFLQKWISNEAHHNLETLTMFIGNEINSNLVRQTIEFEEYDPNEPEKRPIDYFIDIPYGGYFSEEYHLDNNFVEIRRLTDGKRAFVDVGDKHFTFLVYKN